MVDKENLFLGNDQLTTTANDSDSDSDRRDCTVNLFATAWGAPQNNSKEFGLSWARDLKREIK